MNSLEYTVTKEEEAVTLQYLFLKFLKIGMVSFGGHMALVAMVQRELVEKDKVIEQDVITDGISLSGLIPGPVAVNIAAYIGYRLKDKLGAVVAVTGVLLPAISAMLLLTTCYFNYGYKAHWNHVLFYTGGAVAGIILAAGLQMYKKEVNRSCLKNIICIASIVLMFLVKGYVITLALIITGGLLGVILKLNSSLPNKETRVRSNIFSTWKISVATSVLIFIETLYVFNMNQFFQNVYLKICLVFSGISLSLFGGGYVMIPIMQSLLVNDLKWLSSQEFLDCIAFSQVTPGPILVSSVFIGFKMAGIPGALLATMATFVPSAVLMVLVSKIFAVHKNNYWIKNAMAGIKPVVIGLIIVSAFKLLQSLPLNLSMIAICCVTVFVSFKYKVSPVYIILASVIVGAFFTFFQLHI